MKNKFYVLDYPMNGYMFVEIYDEDLKMIEEFKYDPYDPMILNNSSLFKETSKRIEQTNFANMPYELFYYDEHPKNQDPTK